MGKKKGKMSNLAKKFTAKDLIEVIKKRQITDSNVLTAFTNPNLCKPIARDLGIRSFNMSVAKILEDKWLSRFNSGEISDVEKTAPSAEETLDKTLNEKSEDESMDMTDSFKFEPPIMSTPVEKPENNSMNITDSFKFDPPIMSTPVEKKANIDALLKGEILMPAPDITDPESKKNKINVPESKVCMGQIYKFINGTLSLYNQSSHFNFWKLEGEVSGEAFLRKFRITPEMIPMEIQMMKSKLVATNLWNLFIDDFLKHAKITCIPVIDSNRLAFTNTTCYVYCKYKDCKRIFRCKQVSVNDLKYVVVMSNMKENVVHNDEKQHKERSGVTRENIKEMLKIQPVNDVYNKINSKIDDELAELGNTQEKVKKGTLYTMAAEIRKEGRVGCTLVDLPLWANSQEWENVGEDVIKKVGPDRTEKFLQVTLGRNTFYVKMMHAYIPTLLTKAYEKGLPLVLHFDATGSMVKPIRCHDHDLDKRILEYVCITQLYGFSLNVFEFITNTHTQKTQGQMLQYAISEWNTPVFNIVVLDFSWSGINACLLAFNRMEICAYVNLLYKKDVSKTEVQMPKEFVKIGICSSHFMHCLSQFLDRHLKDSTIPENKSYMNLKLFLLQTFFCMMNSTEFEIVASLYTDMAILMLTTYHSTVSRNARERFWHMYKEKDDPIAASNPDGRVFNPDENTIDNAIALATTNREQTAFYQHFINIMKQVKLMVKNTSTSEAKCHLYNPELLELITKHYMPYLFLWSRCGYNDVHPEGRVNNGLIEGYFSNFKNHVLKGKLNLDIMDYIMGAYNNVNVVVKHCRYPSVYKDAVNPRSQRKTKETVKIEKKLKRVSSAPDTLVMSQKEKSPHDPNHQEEWAKKPLKKFRSMGHNKTTSKFADLHVYKRMNAKNEINKTKTKDNKKTIETNDIRSYFKTKLSPVKERKEPKVELQKNYIAKKLNKPDIRNFLKPVSLPKQLDISSKGVVKNPGYYTIQKVMARTRGLEGERTDIKLLEYEDFRALENPEQIRNFVIDFVTEMFVKLSKIGKVKVCDVFPSSAIFLNVLNDERIDYIVQTCQMFTDENTWYMCPFYLLNPYDPQTATSNSNHYMMFMVHCGKRICHFFDSMKGSGVVYFNNFKKSLKTISTKYPDIEHLKYPYVLDEENSMDPQTDGDSCGKHMFGYARRFLLGEQDFSKLDPNFEAELVKNWIFECTMDLYELCTICGKSNTDTDVVNCQKCNRFTHLAHIKDKQIANSNVKSIEQYKCENCEYFFKN